MDLFQQQNQELASPLAEKMRPQSFGQIKGQDSIFSTNRRLISGFKQGRFQSLILWGPPGCGKTSFANALLNELDCESFKENAIDLGAKKIREIGVLAKRSLVEHQRKTLLFVDEIHRLNRGQQDILLPFVEKGDFYLVGATTENPSYQINGALMSRCRLLSFEPLKSQALKEIAIATLEMEEVSLQGLFSEEAFESLLNTAHGDARQLLNALEELVGVYKEDPDDLFPMQEDQLQDFFNASGLRFDRAGDEHYDTISAFIKSVRGSDPDAAIYYLARMIKGGEDPVFIARRLVILASEDIGNGDPQALSLAVSTLQAVELIGLPEARIPLAQATLYLACAPKSNSSYKAINHALSVVEKTGPLPIPKKFRSAKTSLMKKEGYGKGYRYTQDSEKGWLEQEYLPAELKEKKFYEPLSRGFEKRMIEYLKWLRS